MSKNQTVHEFSYHLLSTKAFNCSLCGHILESPVMLNEMIGNVCYPCYSHMDDNGNLGTTIPNTAVDGLLSRILFQCPFKENGCNNRLGYDELKLHKLLCDYRTVDCVCMECLWNGSRYELIKHFSTAHRDKILCSHLNKFEIVINKSMHSDNISLLKTTTGEIFGFRIIIVFLSKKVWYLIYDFENKAAEYEFSVTHQGDTNCLQTPCACVQYSPLNQFNKDEATGIDLTLLNSIASTDQVTLVIKMKDRDSHETVEENDTMLHHFECPVCKSFMKPPIFQCIAGHSLCNFCKPKLQCCPTCRAVLGNTRNFSLEALTSQIQYPCVYHDQGCGKKASASHITSHESSCTYRPYSCIFEGCSFSSNYLCFMNHLTQEHEDRVFTGNMHYFYLQRCNSLRRYVMIHNGHIFKLTYRQSFDFTYWGVDDVFSQNSTDESLFTYQISLIDIRKPEKTITQTHTCLKCVNDENLFRKCCSFHNNIVMSFTTSNVVKFYVRILRKIRMVNF